MKSKTKLYLYLIPLTLFLIFYGCKKSYEPVAVEEELPPGYQKDIPWPSLADSPWPMYHSDPQNTGRSKYVGPVSASLETTFDSLFVETGITVGPDSTFYFISTAYNSGLFAYKNNKLKWKLQLPTYMSTEPSTPLIGSDGTIYFSNPASDKIYAVNPDGSVKWELSGLNAGGMSLNINKDGTLYIGATHKVYAISREGQVKWNLYNEKIAPYTFAISPDGKTLYIPGFWQIGLAAVDLETLTIKWTFGTEMVYASPMVDVAGNIYVFTSLDSFPSTENRYFYSLDPTGNIRWFFKPEDDNPHDYWDPTIDKKGNIYFGSKILYSINYEGTLNWKSPLGKWIGSGLTSDLNGNIFFTTGDIESVIAFDSEGNNLWEVNINKYSRPVNFSPAIGYNFRLYVSSFRSNFVFLFK